MPFEQSDDTQSDASNPDPTGDARPDTLRPDAPPDACVPVQAERLTNPVFDLTPNGMGWVDGRDPATNLLSGGPFPIVTPNPPGVTPNSAPNKAWFGGANGSQVNPPKATLVDTLHQDVVMGANATNVIVSGVILVGTNESGATVYDTFSIDLTETNGTVIENVMAANNTTNTGGVFVPFTKNITANVAGKTIRLRMTSINDNALHTNFFIDSMSLKATQCP